ncbi:hypothetical protein, partial [Methanocalculus sp.]|uniref:hypothetical protein n=1 Tax=Methanocalculus sp. TaxID=2004547 RepID=UPI00260ED1ED
MPFYGYNATYELVNGGGKSVLLMLLMQCILPNTALVSNKPFRDMFVGGDTNRTTHVLAEWELDEGVSEDKYLLTGFCAKKRQNLDENTRNAEVQYFNYIHLYNEKNDLDIHNIPLCWWEGDEFVVQDYARTRSMLQENVSNYHILIADKKREYQELLKNYYLLESEWDLIRSINQRENHLKDHFAKYKKSRTLVEELLVGTIEECIQDRQRLKLRGDDDASSKTSLAEALYQSQGDLKRLQQEQDLLRDYERLLSEVENLNVANDRLMRAYQTYEEARSLAASQYRAYEAAIHQKDNEIAEIRERITRAEIHHQDIQTSIQKIKLMKFNVDVNRSLKDKEKIERDKASLEETVRELDHRYNLALSVNKYLRIKTLEASIHENEEILRNIREEHQDLFNKINPLGKTLYYTLTDEIGTLQQHVESNKAEYRELQEIIGTLKENRGTISAQIGFNNEQIASLRERISQLEERKEELSLQNESMPHITSGLFLQDQIDATIEHIAELKRDYESATSRIETLSESLSGNRSTAATLTEKITHENETLKRLNEENEAFLREKKKAIEITRANGNESIHSCHSYLQIKGQEIATALQEQKSILSKLREELETVEKYGFSLTAEFVRALRVLREYYPTVTSGAEYLKNLPVERRDETLRHAPWLPKTILLLGKQFNDIVRNPSSLPTEVQDSQVIIANLDSLREERNLSLGDVYIPHRTVDHSLDVLSKDRTIENLRNKIEKQNAILAELNESQKDVEDDFTITRKFLERYPEEYESDKQSEILDHTCQKTAYEDSLIAVEQQMQKDNESLHKDKTNVANYLKRIELFESKHRLLEELRSIGKQKENIHINVQQGETQAKELQSSLDQLDIKFERVKIEFQQKNESIRQSESHIVELKREVKDYELYSESDADILSSTDLQSIRSEFSAVKHVIDQKSGDLGEREARIDTDRHNITEYLADIERFGITREEIEAEKPSQPYSDQYMDQIRSNKTDFERRLKDENNRLSEADERYKSLAFDFRKMIEDYNNSAPEAYMPLPELFEVSHLDADLNATMQEKQTVEGKID